ncbi:hypothetical protein C8R44DRAFT_862919 [Mycena epipterygia]|nr:hypothetical protein C8R44DRAFT_862919 [Mycena epipterygia]
MIKFLDIPEDVVQDILVFCDISSVIYISQTNKYLHLLAFTPTLWRALVEDLRHRGFFDRLSGSAIRTMSTQSLIAVVRRVVVGPEAWSSSPTIQSPRSKIFTKILHKLAGQGRTAAPPPAQPIDQIVLHPPISDGNFKILRGGKYVLFCDVDVEDLPFLGCWGVVDDSLLGTYHTSLPIRDFEVEVLHGEHANIVICMHPDSYVFMEVISWDFSTGEIDLLSTTEYAGREFWHPSPKLCSGVAAAHVYNLLRDEKMCLIVDWRAQRYCEIMAPGPNFRVELIPGYLILTWLTGRDTQGIRVIAIASLSGFWTPVVQQNTTYPTLLSDITHVASHTVTSTGGITSEVILAVHESPLQCGIYRVWIYIPYSEPRVLGGSTPRALMCRFQLSLPRTNDYQFTWEQRSCTPAAPTPRTNIISYSGHTRAHVGPHRIFPPDIHSAPIILNLPHAWLSADLAPYSGGVWYPLGETVVLSYFE